jgi:FkbM family methyltransferase
MIIQEVGNICKFYVREDMDTDPIVIREIWEEDVYRMEDQYLNNGGVVLDIGANIGAFSVYCALKGAEVYSIEPEPNNLDILKKNIELNNLQNKIFPIDFGISNFNGTAVINNVGGGSTIKDGKSGSTIKIITFDDLLKQYEIDEVSILKIDIEGSEKELILGASRDSLNKCNYITMEFDIRSGNSLGDMVQKLSETHHVRTMGSWERGGMIWGWRY